MGWKKFKQQLLAMKGARFGGASIYADVGRLDDGCITQVGGASAQLGGNTNYTRTSASGYQTMGGKGRAYKEIFVPAREWISSNSGFSVCATKYLNLGAGHFHIPVVSPCSATCDAWFDAAFPVPLDADTTGSVLATALFYVNTNLTTANSNIGINLWYNYANDAASTTTAGSVQKSAGYGASLAAGYQFAASLGNLPSFGTGGTIVYLTQQWLTGVCSAGTKLDFIGLRLKYLTNKLGSQSAE